MSANVVRVTFKFWKIEWAVIVETEVFAVASDFVENRVAVLDLAVLELLIPLHNLRLCASEHAIKATKNRHRQHDSLILRRSVWAAQKICDGPNKVGELLKVRRSHALKSGFH
jgi:hypothetical protein